MPAKIVTSSLMLYLVSSTRRSQKTSIMSFSGWDECDACLWAVTAGSKSV